MAARTIAHYEILGELGAGGMGVVYRARDTRLDREVAIKALPADFTHDAERLIRFEREAKVLASLNHPHIGAIYGLEEADGEKFLILELVEGETLSHRIARGPVAVSEALELARQIAGALEAAHEKGIIHRDLKPGNINLTPGGAVKVLDFGLAKALATRGASAPEFTHSPTLTYDGTEAGAILGTRAYMSPEQVRGMPADERADIWAFGCVLFEVLAAARAFSGDTAGDTTVAILEHQPDWSLLPTALPARIRVLLERCLRKDPGRRLHHIADARIEVEDALEEASQPLSRPEATPHRRRQTLVAWGVSALAVIAAAIAVWVLKPSPPPESPVPIRFAITLPQSQHLEQGFDSSVAFSPDGKRLAYVGHSSDLNLRPQLYLRRLDEFTADVIPGTEGASGPFFSPDGRWLGFFSEGKLWKIPIAGGRPVAICDTAKVSTGASWGVDDTIVFSVFGSGLLRVSAHGGEPQPLTVPDPDEGELGHQWPQILPQGKGVLFAIVTSEGGRIVVLSPETGEKRAIFEGSSAARYLPTGQLLYRQPLGAWWAAPFDLAKLELSGAPVQILDDVGGPHVSVSESGSIVYAVGTTIDDRTLVWVDRKGRATPITEVRGRYANPSLSPDGRRIAVSNRAGGGNSDIWIHDLERGVWTRLTADGDNSLPVWTPDGSRLAFSSTRSGPINIYWQPADGSGEAEPLVARDYPQFPMSWSADGQHLVYWEHHPDTAGDIWVLSTTGDRRTSPLLATTFNEWGAELSPDGGWLAYVSNESGRDEVYVRRFRGTGGRWQISSDNGSYPVWSADGRELFYRQPGGQMMVVAVGTEPAFTAGRPRQLFEGPFIGAFDVAPDGERFVMTRSVGESQAGRIDLRVVLNWFPELESRFPPGQGR